MITRYWNKWRANHPGKLSMGIGAIAVVLLMGFLALLDAYPVATASVAGILVLWALSTAAAAFLLIE